MDLKANETSTETEHNAKKAPRPDVKITKRTLYPEVSDRFKVVVFWLGIGFVVVVILLQQFSGYS